jgi:hypothetical protein
MIQFYLTLFSKTINNITTNKTFGFKPMWVEKARWKVEYLLL